MVMMAGGDALGAQVADHVHVLVRLRLVVDDGASRRAAGLGALRHQRRHLHQRVVRVVEERQEVDLAVPQDGPAFAALVVHTDHDEFAGGVCAGLLLDQHRWPRTRPGR
jgi:hypothetical protein